ncbi:MAG: hypothetical protein HOP18_10250, partial [Deltaproteobacteria bacterium]|nr:hypothetical protein [Deltaproteobacteria bacterium]
MIWKHLFAVIMCTCFSLTTRLDARADLLTAHSHLNTVMDQYHGSFDVFTDLAAAGNHFPARCAIVRNVSNPGDVAGVAFDEAWARGCRSGSTCIRNRFSAVDPTYWGGWYFQNGVLLGSDTQPRCNWGDFPAAGFPLTGATKITFWVKGERGGERLEFFAGGIGRQACGSTPIKPYPDSFPRVPACGHAITLTTAWRQYTIDLRGQDLRYVVGGFGWVTNASQNPIGATFYLDDIRYDKPRFNEMRFPVSYQVLPVAPGNNFDTILQNVGFTYDNVVVLLSYLASGSAEDRRRATLLADAFVYAQNHDRYYSDGRLRNAYQGGDLILPPGWLPNNRRWTARLPGFWDVVRKKWVEDAAQVGSDTGNMAWVMLGLERAYRILGKPQYLTAARRLGAWAVRNAWDTRGAGGYTG